MQRAPTFRAVVTVCAMGFAAGHVAMGAEYSYSLGYAAQYSDNIRLAAANEEHELVHVLNAGFRLDHDSRDVNAKVAASAAYHSYRNGTFADDSLVRLDGTVVWKALPETFHWTVQDIYSQLVADPTRADTPANRVNANIFSTGPDLFWRLTSVHTLQLGGRYKVSSFEATEDTATTSIGEADNTRRNATLKWLFRPSPVTTFYLGGLTERVEFDDGALQDANFRSNESSIGWMQTVARNKFAIDVGKTRIRQQNGNEFEGGSGRLSWARVLTSDSSFMLKASRTLSDAAEALLMASGLPELPSTPVVSTSDIFISRQVSASYLRRSAHNTFQVSLFKNEREYETTTIDNEESKGLSIDLTHNFADTFSVRTSVGLIESVFAQRPREDETVVGALGFEYRLSRTLASVLTFARQERSSTDLSAEYTENRVVLSLTYKTPLSRVARHVP